nr:hypothetical protein [Tanacetum cinerariifolium]
MYYEVAPQSGILLRCDLWGVTEWRASEIGEPLGAEVDELMVDPKIDELAELIVEVEEQMVAQGSDASHGISDSSGAKQIGAGSAGCDPKG